MLSREEFFFLKLVPCGPINIYVLEREGGGRADNFGGAHMIFRVNGKGMSRYKQNIMGRLQKID